MNESFKTVTPMLGAIVAITKGPRAKEQHARHYEL